VPAPAGTAAIRNFERVLRKHGSFQVRSPANLGPHPNLTPFDAHFGNNPKWESVRFVPRAEIHQLSRGETFDVLKRACELIVSDCG